VVIDLVNPHTSAAGLRDQVVMFITPFTIITIIIVFVYLKFKVKRNKPFVVVERNSDEIQLCLLQVEYFDHESKNLKKGGEWL
jgi:hypothetical protein